MRSYKVYKDNYLIFQADTAVEVANLINSSESGVKNAAKSGSLHKGIYKIVLIKDNTTEWITRNIINYGNCAYNQDPTNIIKKIKKDTGIECTFRKVQDNKYVDGKLAPCKKAKRSYTYIIEAVK